MAEITSIITEANYLHIFFSGPYEHLRKMQMHGEMVSQALKAGERTNLLIDFEKMTGLDQFTIMNEHDLAEFLKNIVSYDVRLAILFPELSNQPGLLIGKHLENVAVNRGVALRVFWQLDEAISWLNQGRDSSVEDMVSEQS